MKILAVDDDPFFLEVLETLLGTGGFTDVTSTTSAAEAAQVVSSTDSHFDCVFIDLRMPEIEGDYLCRWLRRIPAYLETSIVMLTASGKKEDVRRAFMAGASDYITKPIDAIKLVSLARQIAKVDGEPGPGSGETEDQAVAAAQASPTYFEPRQIEGVKRSVTLDALANYLAQISRSDESKLSAVVFRMREGAELHRRCSPAEFNRVLAAVARGILTHAKLAHPFIAYAGSGILIIVSDAAYLSAEERRKIEAAIDIELSAKPLKKDDGQVIKVSVAMMEPLQLGGRTEQQKVTAMYRAIEDAEQEGLSARLGLLKI